MISDFQQRMQSNRPRTTGGLAMGGREKSSAGALPVGITTPQIINDYYLWEEWPRGRINMDSLHSKAVDRLVLSYPNEESLELDVADNTNFEPSVTEEHFADSSLVLEPRLNIIEDEGSLWTNKDANHADPETSLTEHDGDMTNKMNKQDDFNVKLDSIANQSEIFHRSSLIPRKLGDFISKMEQRSSTQAPSLLGKYEEPPAQATLSSYFSGFKRPSTAPTGLSLPLKVTANRSLERNMKEGLLIGGKLEIPYASPANSSSSLAAGLSIGTTAFAQYDPYIYYGSNELNNEINLGQKIKFEKKLNSIANKDIRETMQKGSTVSSILTKKSTDEMFNVHDPIDETEDEPSNGKSTASYRSSLYRSTTAPVSNFGKDMRDASASSPDKSSRLNQTPKTSKPPQSLVLFLEENKNRTFDAQKRFPLSKPINALKVAYGSNLPLDLYKLNDDAVIVDDISNVHVASQVRKDIVDPWTGKSFSERSDKVVCNI